MNLALASFLLTVPGVQGFSIPSSFAGSRPSPRLNAISSLGGSSDPYAPLLDKLNQNLASASTTSSTNIGIDSATVDTQRALLDALSSTLDAANQAAAASAQVSKLASQYPTLAAVDVNAIHTEALSALLARAHSATDETDLASALHRAIDASLHAAEMASHSSAEAVDAMVRFNVQLGHDMSPVWNWASGDWLAVPMPSLVDGMGVPWKEDGWQNFVTVLDRKWDDLTLSGGVLSTEGAAVLAVYGIVAYLVGYASQSADLEGYKSRIRRGMEDGTFDVDQLVKDVGYVKTNLATAAPILASVDYDAAARLAYQSSKETVSFEAFKARYLRETSTMIAKKNPYVKAVVAPKPSSVSAIAKHNRLTSVDYDAAAKLAYQASNPSIDFPAFQSQYLAEASAMVAQKHKDRHDANATPLPAPPVQDISAESFLKQPMVNVVTKSKPIIVQSTPPASPLARLLAEELGLDLTSIGKGSGKNGKILIEDVRSFQESMERARRSIAGTNAPYFATANA